MSDAADIDPAAALAGEASPLRALLALAELLSGAADVAQVAAIVATTGVDALGASAGFVAVESEDGRSLEMYAHVRTDVVTPLPMCRFAADEQLPVVEAWRFGLPILIGTAAELYERYPVLDPSRTLREALAALPLEVDGVRLGAINLTFGTEQSFDAEQQAVLRAIAGLCGQALRRVQLAADLERLRHDFVVTASHELKTPLSSIYGAAVAMAGEFDLSDTARRELTQLIVTESQRMQAVIDDLRVTSDLDGDAPLLLDTQPIEVERALRDSTVYWQRHPNAAPDLKVDVPASVPPVAADARRLQQVLVNLVDNACKYGGRDGVVTLTASCDDDPGRVRIVITDEGPGMTDRDRSRAFEQFFRADPLNRGGIAGTGLGLYVARKLVLAMDGQVTLEPTGDGARGTHAIVELPAWRTS